MVFNQLVKIICSPFSIFTILKGNRAEKIDIRYKYLPVAYSLVSFICFVLSHHGPTILIILSIIPTCSSYKCYIDSYILFKLGTNNFFFINFQYLYFEVFPLAQDLEAGCSTRFSLNCCSLSYQLDRTNQLVMSRIASFLHN